MLVQDIFREIGSRYVRLDEDVSSWKHIVRVLLREECLRVNVIFGDTTERYLLQPKPTGSVPSNRRRQATRKRSPTFTLDTTTPTSPSVTGRAEAANTEAHGSSTNTVQEAPAHSLTTREDYLLDTVRFILKSQSLLTREEVCVMIEQEKHSLFNELENDGTQLRLAVKRLFKTYEGIAKQNHLFKQPARYLLLPEKTPVAEFY